jgi:hypothetical protein
MRPTLRLTKKIVKEEGDCGQHPAAVAAKVAGRDAYPLSLRRPAEFHEQGRDVFDGTSSTPATDEFCSGALSDPADSAD